MKRNSKIMTVGALTGLMLLGMMNGCGGGGHHTTTQSSTALQSTIVTSYSIKGELNGLPIGKSVVIQNNGGDDLTLDADGSFAFSTKLPNGTNYSVSVKTQPDGQSCFVTNGTGTVSGTDVTSVSVNCFDSGSLDASFGTNGTVSYDGGNGDSALSVVIDANGRLVVTGYSKNTTDFDMLISRYNADGTPDSSFGTGGVVTYDSGNHEVGIAVTIDADGKILITGAISITGNTDMAIWRYNADGTPDTSFGTNGVVTYDSGGLQRDIGLGIAIDTDGKILVTGYTVTATDKDMTIWRYNADGTADTSFDTNGVAIYDSTHGDDSGISIKLDTNGRIVVTGYSHNGTDHDMTVWRYKANGTLDSSFDTDGVVTYNGGNGDDEGQAVILDSDGKIVVTGFSDNGSAHDMLIWRYNTDGTLDSSFDTDGIVVYNSGNSNQGNDVTVDENGRITVAGVSSNGADNDMAIWRCKADGTPDTMFDTDGMVSYDSGNNDGGYTLVLDADGKIIVAGKSGAVGAENMMLWRYIP